jgi:hypothetical protein
VVTFRAWQLDKGIEVDINGDESFYQVTVLYQKNLAVVRSQALEFKNGNLHTSSNLTFWVSRRVGLNPMVRLNYLSGPSNIRVFGGRAQPPRSEGFHQAHDKRHQREIYVKENVWYREDESAIAWDSRKSVRRLGPTPQGKPLPQHHSDRDTTCMLPPLPGQLQGEIRPVAPLPAGDFKASFRPRNRPYRAGIKIL